MHDDCPFGNVHPRRHAQQIWNIRRSRMMNVVLCYDKDRLRHLGHLLLFLRNRSHFHVH